MKILIAEDNPTNRTVLKGYLAAFGELHIAIDGEQAIQVFIEAFDNNEPFDLICLDIMMPEKDGQDVLTAVRAYEKQHDIPITSGTKVIMTTALDDAKNVLGAFKNGCESYITKPIDRQQLMVEINKLGLAMDNHKLDDKG